jgi:hypothetical protein
LELDTTHFEAGYGRVMVPIPIHIWETIRHLGGARLDLVDKQDDDLMAMVHGAVDQRIAKYRQAMQDNPGRAAFTAFLGCLVYGTANAPRADQIRKGVEYFRREQQRQREVQARISALRIPVPTSDAVDTTR